MPYVTSIERLGRREGRLECLVQCILNVLEARSGPVPDALRERVRSLRDEPTFRKLRRLAVQAPSRAKIQAELDQEP